MLLQQNVSIDGELGLMSDLIEIIKGDYQRFPHDQTYDIYAVDVHFQDPLTRFRGIDRYRRMIGFIARWFQHPQLDLHHICQNDRQIHTEWTLSWTVGLPWHPRLCIRGYTKMHLNTAGLIESHRDYWYCSPLDVLKQLLPVA